MPIGVLSSYLQKINCKKLLKLLAVSYYYCIFATYINFDRYGEETNHRSNAQ